MRERRSSPTHEGGHQGGGAGPPSADGAGVRRGRRTLSSSTTAGCDAHRRPAVVSSASWAERRVTYGEVLRGGPQTHPYPTHALSARR